MTCFTDFFPDFHIFLHFCLYFCSLISIFRNFADKISKKKILSVSPMLSGTSVGQPFCDLKSSLIFNIFLIDKHMWGGGYTFSKQTISCD